MAIDIHTLAIIPARMGSEGIPHKNFRKLLGISPTERAITAAVAAQIPQVVLSTDAPLSWFCDDARISWQDRPAALATGTTTMSEVVQYVLAHVPGPDDQMIVLLQPTQPLRTSVHITDALTLLQRPDTDSVVSVVALPPTHHPVWQYLIDARDGGRLHHQAHQRPGDVQTRRQVLPTTYIRDGTVYAFWRRTVRVYRGIYGKVIRPLVIQAAETCALDTLEDWAEAERRLLVQAGKRN